MSDSKQINLTDLWNPAINTVWNVIAPFVIGKDNRGDVPKCPYDELFMMGGRACVDGDTMIATPSGDIKIKDFRGGIVYAQDRGGMIVEADACAPTRYNPEKMYRVRCANGAAIICTAEHRFLTLRGWVACSELNQKDSLLCVSCLQDAPQVATSTISPSAFLKSQKVSYVLRESYYGEHRRVSHEDVARLTRKLLGSIYRYSRDFHLCDGQLLEETDTFQDVLRLLGDVQTHSHESSRTDGSCVEDNDIHSCQCEHRLSTQDSHLQSEGIHCARTESEICEMLSEWLSEICQTAARSQKIEDLACKVRQVALRLLSSKNEFHLDSCSPKVTNTLQTLFDTLEYNCADDSYSDSIGLVDGVNLSHHYTKGSNVMSIEYVGEREFYDFFVPFYNNYIGNGIVNHNSGKSTAASAFIWLALENDPRKNAVIIRKVQSSLRKSCWKQMMKMREKLDFMHWKPNKTELTFTNSLTGQQIFFVGLDDEEKVRSITVEKGYISIAWFEEAKQFKSMEEIDQAVSSLLRGGADDDEKDYDAEEENGDMEYMTILTYNPPKSSFEWINREAKLGNKKPNRFTHKSTYLTMPKKWLGSKVLNEIEVMKKLKPEQYRHMYLGEVTGTGAEYYKNVTLRKISDEEIRNFDYFDMGIDFGMLDPNTFTKSYLKDGRLFIFDEIYQDEIDKENKYKKFAKLVLAHTRDCPDDTIWCDAQGKAEMSILTSGEFNIPCECAPKHGKTGRDEGYKWMQSLIEIIIDPERCPHAAEEFTTFESLPAPGGNGWLDKPGKYGDHLQDSIRYSHWQDIESADMNDDGWYEDNASSINSDFEDDDYPEIGFDDD